MQNMTDKRWYYNSGTDNDTAVSTRIRLARNVKGYPFPARLTTAQKEEFNSTVCNAVKGMTVQGKKLMTVKMDDLSEKQCYAMVERHLISPEFAASRQGRTLILSEDEGISIMLCEEDHLRIQVMKSGQAVSECLETALELEKALSEKLEFAFDERLGYLTACPTNLGTAMRASVMLHLPALESKNAVASLANTVSKIGLTLRGSFGEGSKADSGLYQLSNQITLGITEESAAQNLVAITNQVIQKERAARKEFESIVIEDKAYRAYAVLKNARLLSFKELGSLIGVLRIALTNGILTEIDHQNLTSLIFDTKQANIALCNKGADTPAERDRVRAQIVRERI